MLLIVEDNPHFSATIKRALEKHGMSFDIVDRGVEAVERLLHHGDQYSVVLIDVLLPDLGADQIVPVVRAIGDPRKSGVPIILMTGGEPVPTSLVESGGICAVLYKPFLVSALLDTIARCARWGTDRNPDRVGDEPDVQLEDLHEGRVESS